MIQICPIPRLALRLSRAVRGATLAVTLATSLISKTPAKDLVEFTKWDAYGGDPTGAKFSGLQQINRLNVRNLKPAWIFRCDDMRAGSTIECNPIIIGDLM